MPNTVTEGADKALSRDQLNALIGQKEDDLGPLYAIANDGGQSTLTFNTDENSPAVHARLISNAGSGASIPAGASKVCDGTIFVSGALEAEIAVR